MSLRYYNYYDSELKGSVYEQNERHLNNERNIRN